MPVSLESTARDVLAVSYGIQNVTIRPIGYGLINWLARVDVRDRSYVLKRYNPALFDRQLVELSVQAQHHCYARGVPAPALVPNQDSDLITWAPDAGYVLSTRVEGRHLPRGHYSPTAARSLGEAVGHIVVALADNWRARREPWTLRKPDEVIGRFERLLAAAEAGTTDLDRRTAQDARLRLTFLHRHSDLYARLSALPMQWIHNDLLDTNVLFGGDDQVAAVLDFDNVSVLPRGFDFMWALAFGVTSAVPERDDYLRGYVDVAHPSRDELATYVPLWTYKAVCDPWPLETRYLDSERFDPRWEFACWEAFLPDDWEAMMKDLADWLTRR
jgi:Ser/Thr protein kinase RdoA (MazF antagonist)